ncbi:unnamed protein product [Effrenium voratum]|nr:unnamed protein product [Effrenium voratum]
MSPLDLVNLFGSVGLGLAEALCSFPPPLPRLAGDLPARLDRAVSSGLGCGSLDFVEVVAERIIWEGLLFNPDADEEEPFLADADSSYERCPGALLLAILSCAARATEKSLPGQADAWNNAFAAWNSLPWTQPLAWHNLQDPLLRPALYAAVSQSKVLAACLQRPADVCSKVVSTLVDHLARAAGLSLSVAADGFVNLPGYGELGLSMLVMANYPHLLEPDVCVGARLMAHLFTARRLLDLKPFLAEHHVYAAQELTRKLMRNGTLYPEYAGAVNTLGHGLEAN